MLARMLRLTIAMQMVFGAAIGYWLSEEGSGLAPLVLQLALCALAAPLLMNLLTVGYGFVRSRSGESTALWCKALIGECQASVQFFLLRQPWAFDPPSLQQANSKPARIPVLLVHGFVCNHRVWDVMAPALVRRGHTVLAVNLEPLFTSIDDYAEQLEQAVQTLRQQTGQQQIALIGHSMGGLVIRAWMRRYGSQLVARAITLGTPHAGTQLRSMVSTPNGLQMVWHSIWLKDLAASETDAIRHTLRLALSAQDNVVYPQRAQTLAGVTPKVFEGLGHVQLCKAPEVLHWVASELALL